MIVDPFFTQQRFLLLLLTGISKGRFGSALGGIGVPLIDAMQATTESLLATK